MFKNRKQYSVFAYSFVLFLITCWILSTGASPAQEYAKYQKYDQFSNTLKNLVNTKKNIAKIESIGKTLEGRDLWLVTIANQNGAPLEERSALFIGANFEGDHVIGSQLSLAIIDYLLKNYDSDEQVKKSIDEHVYYVLPRANPDAAEHMFASVKTGKKTNTKNYDGDNDGRMDEDGPEDLNKDGYITVMRVKDANGDYLIDPDDSRLMKKADPAKGEIGEYKIFWEGTDNDKDGFYNEDPPGGVDINRNFQHEYPYFKADAGWHMVSELESRAVMDWIIAHRNVAMILTFGESDNLIKAPNNRGQLSSDRGLDLFNFADASNSEAGRVGMVSTTPQRFGRFGFFMMGERQGREQQEQSGRSQRPARKPETTVNKDDQAYYNAVSEKYKEILGIKVQPVLREPKGAFFQYGYFQYGVPSFSTPGWGIDVPADTAAQNRRGLRGRSGGSRSGQPPEQVSQMRSVARDGAQNGDQQSKPGVDKEFIKWLDKENKQAFIEWKSYHHPSLGNVEIGGFSPYDVVNPPESKIAELGKKHGEFVAYLSTLFATVKIAKTEVIKHGSGLFRIKAEVENIGFLPIAMQQGVTSRSVKPTMVQLGVEPDQIISGNNKTNFIQTLAGSGNREKFEWIISGKSGDKVELKVVAQKGGTDIKVITLQ